MITHIYSVFDRAVGAYMQPFHARSEGEAIRMIRQAVNTPDTQFHANPGDYQLNYLGEFHDNTGEIVLSGPPTPLISLSSLTAGLTPET